MMIVKAVLLFACLGICAASASKKYRKAVITTRQLQGSCAENQFQCTGGRCIDAEWTCDSDEDCFDGSDETLPECPPPGQCTGPHEVACRNGRCVPLEFKCDGDDDCRDGTDEEGCPDFLCSPGESKCANGLCIATAWFCDGEDDCGDNSDEDPARCPAK